MSKILVVIDMQKKFIEECRAQRIVPAVVNKIKKRIVEGYEVVFTSDKCGGELAAEISAINGAKRIFKKHTYGSGELVCYLKEKEPATVEFIGICTDICVITNVLGTMVFLPFAELIVDGNCCAAESEAGHFSAMRVMKSCNIKIKC